MVERPASVLKELVENALDAGATQIRVQLRAGGRELVRVEDNGHGMDPDDVLMCIERHGTSKIRGEEDLGRVHTLGFRGEALPSIASVARLEIVSRPESAEAGFKVVVEGGRMRKPEPTGAPVGTRVSVRNLFFNIPVRRGFLRTVPTELGHCVEAVLREALVRPTVDFRVEHEGRTLLRAPLAPDRARRAVDLLRAHGEALMPASFSAGALEVEALLSPVGVHKASAAGAMYLYVNGRYVRDPTLRRAINQAYRHLVPRGRYPVVVLEVRLPVEDVDVNIHPAKTEVRFRFSQDLFEAVSEGVRDQLQKEGMQSPEPFQKRAVHPGQSELPLMAAEPAGTQGAALGPGPQALSPPRAVPAPEPASFQASNPASVASQEGGVLERGLGGPVQPWRGPSSGEAVPLQDRGLRVIGAMGERYMICAKAGDLLVFSVAAVQAALLAEELEDGHHSARPLLTPALVELDSKLATALRARLTELPGYLRIEDYGEGTFAVMAVPAAVARADLPALVHAIAQGQDPVQALVQAAGSAAPKALSPFELKALAKRLSRLDCEALSLRVPAEELARRLL